MVQKRQASGAVSAAFTAFNKEKEAELLKEIAAEDAKAEAKDRLAAEKQNQANKKERDRLMRRNNLLAMGMSEEELEELGLGLHELDDDPSVCTQVAHWWRQSALKKILVVWWMKLPCNQRRSVPVVPDDDRFIKGGATRKKCTHVCLLYQQNQCCWCSDTRDILVGRAQRKEERHRQEEEERGRAEKERLKEEKRQKRLQKKRDSTNWRMTHKQREKLRVQEEQEKAAGLLEPSVLFDAMEMGAGAGGGEVGGEEAEEAEEAVVKGGPSRYVVRVGVRQGNGGVNNGGGNEDDRVYPGYVEGVVRQDLNTRDEFYCHVCRTLGRGGRNIAQLVLENNAALDAKKSLEDKIQEEAAVEEEQAMEEAMRLVRLAEEAAKTATTKSVTFEEEGHPETPEVEEGEGGKGREGVGGVGEGGEQQQPRSPQPAMGNVVKVDLGDASNTVSEKI